MNKAVSWLRYLMQALNYTVFMLVVWYFSSAATYQHFEQDKSLVVLSFKHAGQKLQPCRRLSQDELATLPPNMRNPVECGRERSPINVELKIDGKKMLGETLYPPGLFNDGSANFYKRVKVPTGRHHISIGINDSIHIQGFNYRHAQEVNLAPGQLLVIDFNDKEGFTLK